MGEGVGPGDVGSSVVFESIKVGIGVSVSSVSFPSCLLTNIKLIGSAVVGSPVKGSGVGRTNCALADGVCAIGRQIMAIRPNPTVILTEYLFFNLRGRFAEFQQLRQGAAIPGIRKEHVEAIELPIPPIPVQEQVVSQLEIFRVEIAELQESNVSDLQLLFDIEQAILAQAFRGEL